MKATKPGRQTCVGFHGPYPRAQGNCLWLICEDFKERHVINFNAENLEYLLKHTSLEFPLEVVLHPDRPDHYCYINEPRIAERWYRKDMCRTCCAWDMLPLHQQLAGERDKARKGEPGKIILPIIDPDVTYS